MGISVPSEGSDFILPILESCPLAFIEAKTSSPIGMGNYSGVRFRDLRTLASLSRKDCLLEGEELRHEVRNLLVNSNFQLATSICFNIMVTPLWCRPETKSDESWRKVGSWRVWAAILRLVPPTVIYKWWYFLDICSWKYLHIESKKQQRYFWEFVLLGQKHRRVNEICKGIKGRFMVLLVYWVLKYLHVW